MSVKILHFADAHIDIANSGPQDAATTLAVRAMDFLKSLDFIVETAIQEQVDAVVFAGDAYKDRTPSPTFQREWDTRIIRLSKAGIPTILVVGNHDISPSTNRAHTMEEFKSLSVSGVIVVDRPTIITPQMLGKPLQIVGIPWISKSGLMTTLGEKMTDIEDIYDAMETKLTGLVEAMLKKLDPTIPTVLTAHAAVQGAKLGAERSLSLGAEMTLSMGILTDSRIDYAALGHIHTPQNMNEGNHPPVIYPGSIERVNFGEVDDKKYVVIATIDRGATKLDWRELPIRPFVDKSVTIRPDTTDPVQRMIHALGKVERLEGAMVRLVINYPKDMEALIDEEAVRRHAKGALQFHLVKKPEAKARVRIPEAGIQTMTPWQMLDIYLKTVKAENMGELMKVGKSIFAEAMQGGESSE